MSARLMLKHIPKYLLAVMFCSSANSAFANEPFFADNFDQSVASQSSRFSWSGGNRVSTDHSFSGNSSLKFSFGPDAMGEDSWSEQRFILAPDASSAPTEVWFEYMLRLPENFIHRNDAPTNNKLFALWAEKYSNPGDVQAVFEYERKSDGDSRVRVVCMSGTGCLKGQRHADMFEPGMSGRWVRMRVHVKAGNGDGIIELWRDSTLVYSIQNYQHYFSGGNNYWRHGYLMGWSNSGFSELTDFYIDDFKVYDKDPGWGNRPLPPEMLTAE